MTAVGEAVDFLTTLQTVACFVTIATIKPQIPIEFAANLLLPIPADRCDRASGRLS
ncbi:MAG: hypothetical protein KME60_13665 [Cyanomargarita calcarea GSE-NOS-MK-12-04C]|uniref:Uncharacterized protein n=1 Tax=Cyanomargarita calcarea GSE-NOS-MK-12-04C TaxID=2839659 RepID=A0A951QNX6_9CYAN|nr:hypothetical protein [Cyanomargarita calcarea GSE-NOS-MK-12-04C]